MLIVWKVICLLSVGIFTANATSYGNTTTSTMTMTDNTADDNRSSGLLVGGFLTRKRKKNNDNNKEEEQAAVRVPLRHAKGSSQWGFVGEIGVGKDTYEVMFDTLSSNTWLFHQLIEVEHGSLFKQKKKSKRTKKNQFYDFNESDTATVCGSDKVLTLQYSDGSIYGGGIVEEHLKIGQFTVEDFMMMWVAGMDGDAEQRGGDFKGMVGLGGEGFAVGGGSEVVRELFYGKSLRQPMFSFYVSDDMESGEIMFGDLNEDLIAEGGKMAFFPALKMTPLPEDVLSLDIMMEDGDEEEEDHAGGDDDTYILPWADEFTKEVVWALKFDTFSIGDTKMKAGFRAAFGTTLPYGIVVPTEDDLGDLVKLIGNGAELSESSQDETKLEVVINCDVREKLPDLTLAIRRSHMTFSGMEYFPTQVPGKNGKCSSFFGARGLTEYDRYGDPDMWKLGVHFMRKYYTVYNEKDDHYQLGPSIGIALSDGKGIPYGGKTSKTKKSLKKIKRKMGLGKKKGGNQ